MSRGEESYASIHHKAVRENLRTEMNRAINEIYEATHAAVYRDGKIYSYGTAAACRNFAKGLSGMTIRGITVEEQNALAKHKRIAYKNP